MKKFESTNKKLSNWQIGEDNQIIKNQSAEDTDVENKKIRSDQAVVRAMSDLKNKWYEELGLDDLLADHNMRSVFIFPDNYKETINGSQENFQIEDFIVYLENEEFEIRKIISELEEKKQKAVQDRLDYQNTSIDNFDKELKSELEARINKIDEMIGNGNEILKFLQDKKINI